MNYYPHHIGDFNNATRHLTRVERALYRDLIELYYDSEQPLTGDVTRLCRKVIAATNDEKEAVVYVLSEFFELIDGEYIHHRCDLEIEKYRANNSAKARAGKASAEARRKKKAAKNKQKGTGVEHTLNTTPTELEQNPTNQEPVTKNQEPLKDISPAAPVFVFKKSLLDHGVDPDVVDAWLAVRRKKKSSNSEIALKAVVREAEKAGLSMGQAITISVEKSWAGFDASWYENLKGNSNATRQSSNTAINHDDTSWLTGSPEGPGNGEAGEQDISRASDSLHRLETGH